MGVLISFTDWDPFLFRNTTPIYPDKAIYVTTHTHIYIYIYIILLKDGIVTPPLRLWHAWMIISHKTVSVIICLCSYLHVNSCQWSKPLAMNCERLLNNNHEVGVACQTAILLRIWYDVKRPGIAAHLTGKHVTLYLNLIRTMFIIVLWYMK